MTHLSKFIIQNDRKSKFKLVEISFQRLIVTAQDIAADHGGIEKAIKKPRRFTYNRKMVYYEPKGYIEKKGVTVN